MDPSPPQQDDWPLSRWFELRDAWLALAVRILVLQAVVQALLVALVVAWLYPEEGLWGPVVSGAGMLLWGQLTGVFSQAFLRQGYQGLSACLNASARRWNLVRTQVLVGSMVGTLLAMPLIFGWVQVETPRLMMGTGALMLSNLTFALLLSQTLESRRVELLPPLLGPPAPPSPAGWIAPAGGRHEG